MRTQLSKMYVGGRKKNNGCFAYFEGLRMHIGWNHVPMTAVNRCRHLSRYCGQKGRKLR